MNQFNSIHGDETTEPPIERNIQPPAAHFKSRITTLKTSPVVSDDTGIINYHAIDNGDVEVHPSEIPFQYNSESVPDPNTTLVKSIDDGEKDHLLELFHSEHYDNILDINLQMLQT